ncbi:MAG: Ribonuclease [Arcobacter lacus]|nr:MAG: Ribonuclease [Arcobacter lacus]
MAFYKSCGAALEVTGSCHLIEIGKIKILVDCGMFQGQESFMNFDEFPFDPSEINYLILTHAHIDHIGRVPLLFNKGFTGHIISTKSTFKIAILMLKNSAGILQTKEEKLYSLDDVYGALKLFDSFLENEEVMILEGGVKLVFKNTGHILGSVSAKLEFLEDGIKKGIIFSGDIGQKHRIISSPVEYWDSADYLFIESTYGSSLHEDIEISIESFKTQIMDAIKQKSVIVIPSFALERTQEVLFLLRQMSLEGKLENIPVFLDSPLAIDVTKAFVEFPQLFSKEVKEIILNGDNPFEFKELEKTYTKQESLNICTVNHPKIIIAGSGMCEGGRVGYHLEKYAKNPNNLILFVGFQVNHTIGRKISTKNNEVELNGKKIEINAKVSKVSGFSSHADQKELINWIEAIRGLDCIYLVHGEEPQLNTLKKKIKTELNNKAHVVKYLESIHL